jgi:hypothetical protein
MEHNKNNGRRQEAAAPLLPDPDDRAQSDQEN